MLKKRNAEMSDSVLIVEDVASIATVYQAWLKKAGIAAQYGRRVGHHTDHVRHEPEGLLEDVQHALGLWGDGLGRGDRKTGHRELLVVAVSVIADSLPWQMPCHSRRKPSKWLWNSDLRIARRARRGHEISLVTSSRHGVPRSR